MKRALVLLSGGQDSTTTLFWAKHHFDEVDAISLFYGQRHSVELDAARQIAELACVHYHRFDLPQGLFGAGSALTDKTLELKGEGGIADREMPKGLPTSFVPGRNMVFLAIAASAGAARGITDIVTGVCQTDYSGYPDCRDIFVQAMSEAATQAMPSSLGPIKIHTPLMNLTKAETVKLAQSLPGCMEALALSVTCYNGQRPGCGTCPSCELRAVGFAEAGVKDPAS